MINCRCIALCLSLAVVLLALLHKKDFMAYLICNIADIEYNRLSAFECLHSDLETDKAAF